MAFSFSVFLALALGECLPRDGSAQMTACDLEKAREIWVYPLLVIVLMALAIVAELERKIWAKALVGASGLLALAILFLVEAAIR